MIIRLGALLCLAACGAQVGGPSWREPPPERLPTTEFAPVGQPSARYNEPTPAGNPTPLERRILDAVAGAAVDAHVAAPAADPRLSAVASELATLVTGEGAPPYDAEEFALRHHGIIEPTIYVLVVQTKGHDDDGVVDEFRSKVAAMIAGADVSRAGVGMSQGIDGVTTVVLTMLDSQIVTDPFPRELSRGGSFQLKGHVLGSYAAPEIYVAGQAGGVTTVPVTHDGPAGFHADVRCGDALGRLNVEVVAEDRVKSPTVLANFPVYCGTQAPRTLALRPPVPDPPGAGGASLERSIFALLNGDRKAAGLPPLAWDDRAAGAARAHSEDMRDKRFVSHVSPTAGDLSARAKRAGLASTVILENLARSSSAAEAEQELMDSPGHRANILSNQATHVGIGVAEGQLSGVDHVLYVTQIFLRVIPRLDAAEARRRVLQAFLAARSKAGLPAMSEDATLDGIASAYANGLALGKDSREVLARHNSDALDALSNRGFGSVMTVVGVTAHIDAPIDDATIEPGAQFFGIGVAQGNSAALGEGALFVVVLLAKNR